MFVEDYGKTKFDFDKQNNIKLTIVAKFIKTIDNSYPFIKAIFEFLCKLTITIF